MSTTTPSASLNEVIDRLLGDMEFVNRFLADPAVAIEGYDLTDEERSALLARDIDALERLGIDRDTAEGASSGKHSQRCPNVA